MTGDTGDRTFDEAVRRLLHRGFRPPGSAIWRLFDAGTPRQRLLEWMVGSWRSVELGQLPTTIEHSSGIIRLRVAGVVVGETTMDALLAREEVSSHA